jgi:hypothetical protein
MRIPPTVGCRPRWDQSSEPEYIYLSHEGYPLHARRALKKHPGPSPLRYVEDETGNFDLTDTKSHSPVPHPAIVQFQELVNPYPMSSTGILMREFNRPFPRFQHRISQDRLALQTPSMATSQIHSESGFQHQKVAGMLWPAPTSSYRARSSSSGILRRARTALESSAALEVPQPRHSPPTTVKRSTGDEHALSLTNSTAPH